MAEKSAILDWLAQARDWLSSQFSGIYNWLFGGEKRVEASTDNNAPFKSFSATHEIMKMAFQ